MKFISSFIIILVFISFFSCMKNSSPLDTIPSEFSSSDDSIIPDSIRSLYRLDAAWLAVNHIYKNKLADTASVIIPEQLIETFYSGLIHIYNCNTIPSIETITKTWPVHIPAAYPNLHRLAVGIDTNYSWTKQWTNGFRFTGNDTIDSLLIEYELELSKS